MEVLLLAACVWLVHTHGAQSEQAKLGLSPAQRDILRERARHEKSVQKIADKHGVAAPAERGPGVSPWKEPPASERGPVLTLPEAFRSGYRGHTRIERLATPVGRRAGLWTARGVAWAEDTGRGALREYRKRRRARGEPDPAPVLVPVPPRDPSADPPTVGTGSGKGEGVSLARPDPPSEPEAAEKPPEGASEAPTADGRSPEASTDPTAPEKAADEPVPVPPPATEEMDWAEAYKWDPSDEDWLRPAEAAEPKSTDEPSDPAMTEEGTTVTEPVTAVTDSDTEPASAVTEPGTTVTEPGSAVTEPVNTTKEPAAAGEGVGRMAAEVSYESVEEESDELSLMCEDDLVVYDRIGKRCQREISRGDSLLVAMEAVGFGPKVMGWVTRGKEQYGVIDSQLDELKSNTKAQGEGVVKAKALLVAGQGLYAGIAKDMESVADREVYISDAVDAEDTSAHTEVYETRGA
ncbi:hypothetical protein [Streptomyces sp. BK340]|uniref:hypothetical protein n=1 Tax=Streptomyces sp. BK340 TaxID=2572903 RepID=UPI0011A89D6B|nr:hypothetical protein [Streptomyces sp. BK340]TVZ90467.1 hypothetical protein FB157_111125 [Streptomyces sp. BK340]